MEVLEGRGAQRSPSSPDPPLSPLSASPNPTAAVSPVPCIDAGVSNSSPSDTVSNEFQSRRDSPAALEDSQAIPPSPLQPHESSPSCRQGEENYDPTTAAASVVSNSCEPLEQRMEQASISSPERQTTPKECTSLEERSTEESASVEKENQSEDVPMDDVASEQDQCVLAEEGSLEGGKGQLGSDERYSSAAGGSLDQEVPHNHLSESEQSHLSEPRMEEGKHQDGEGGVLLNDGQGNIEGNSGEDPSTGSDPLSNEIEQRNLMDTHSIPLLQEGHHLQNSQQTYPEQQHCSIQDYSHPLSKLSHHPLQDLHNHLQRDNSLHDFDLERLHHHHAHHHHMLVDTRRLQQDDDPSRPQQLPLPPQVQQTDRSHEGYWNLHLGMLSKVKSESKEWYDDQDGMTQDSLGGIKSEPHDPYSNYHRLPPHHSGLGPDASHLPSINGPRPNSLPQGGLPFSPSPDPRHYQGYPSHPGVRDMSPMSPGFQGHGRQPHQHQVHPGVQHQHPGLQHPGHHGGGQHLQQQQQQYPGQQHYGNQPQLGMQGHPGQGYHQGLGGHMGPGMGGHLHEGREGREGDPYSFVDEYTGPPPRPVEEILGQTQPKRRGRKPKHIKLMENGGDPLAIAAAQAAHEAKKRKWRQMGPDGKPIPIVVKPRKRLDRFDGIPEDELAKKTLPDHLAPNLDVVIISKFPFQIGINPGLFAAYKGHHYAGPGNHFWKCLYLSGLIPEPLTSDDDSQLLEHGIGFTNIVSRTTRGSAELTRKEIKEGGQILLAKLQRYQPRVAVFNGKGIYEIFSGKKEFTFGRQPEKIEGTQTHVWVMPSSSARCAQLPRALDKVPFYTALRKFRDFLKGTLTELTEDEITFTSPKSKHFKAECEKLQGSLGEELSDSFLDDPLKDELDSRFESDLDSDEIHRSITQSLYNLAGVTREQLEAMDCATIPIRKKRGRPKKTPDDPNMPIRPKPRPIPTELMLCNGEEPPRKKRGRPKKVLEDGTIPPPKRPGRKPKALKEMLAAQAAMGQSNVHQNAHHQQMTLSHLNGIMSPSGGYNSNIGPSSFSPQYGSSQNLHSLNSGPNNDRIPPIHSGLNPNSIHGMNNSLIDNPNLLHGGARNLSGQTLGSLQPGGLNSSMQQQSGCTTPNSNSSHSTPVHGGVPPRGHTPHSYGQSPGYSPSPASGPHSQQLSAPYGSSVDKSDLQLEDEHELGLSPPPASPIMAQPDFEPPTSLPDTEPVRGGTETSSIRPLSSTQNDELGLLERQQHTPSLQSQLSNPSTPADDSTTPYQGFPGSYPGGNKSCSPSYNSNVAPSPSYPVPVSHSPSYAPNVSCSPSYTSHNTQSPSYPPNSTQSPSYHQSPSYPSNSTQSPSFPPNISRSPSYLNNSTHSPSFSQTTNKSPSYHTNNTHSPSYHTSISHSPSYSAITQSPSYSSSLTHSPSYPNNNNTQSPYRPPTSQSPSFSSNATHSPSLNKPLVAGVHSPQLSKGDVASKSLHGLESLVDQIPSLNENESGGGPHSSHSTTGPCSNPTTPGPSAGPPQFSPGHVPPQGSFQNFASNGSTGFPPSHYGSPQSSHPYSPHYSSSSTNLSTNFSVSSLANSSLTTSLSYSSGYDVEPTSCTTTTSSSTAPVSSSCSSFSVSSLTGGSPTSTPNMYNNNNSNNNGGSGNSSSYSPAPPGPSPHSYSDIMGSSILPPTPPMSSSFMGSPGLMGSTSGMQTSMGGSAMGSFHSSMNMSTGSQLPYPYPQYGSDSSPGYSGPAHSSFPYPASSPGFHVPTPRFPYPSPYSGVPYSQGYSQNAMLERIKQTGMGMGFSGF